MDAARALAGCDVVADAVTGHHRVHGLSAFATGAVIARFTAVAVLPRPSRYTVQVGMHEHIELAPEALRYVNHSCDPNVAFDVELSCLVALRPIDAGEELTFFYPSTEWEMDEPFRCWCGTDRCIGEVRGAADLPAEVLAQYALAPHVRRLLSAA